MIVSLAFVFVRHKAEKDKRKHLRWGSVEEENVYLAKENTNEESLTKWSKLHQFVWHCPGLYMMLRYLNPLIHSLLPGTVVDFHFNCY